MRRVLPLNLLLAVLLAACVTVNVYFPAAAAEKAADQIIDTVTGTSGSPQQSQPSKPQSSITQPGASELAPLEQRGTQPVLLAAAGNLLELLIPAANAQGGVNLDVSTPEVRAVVGSMAARNGQLKPFFESGGIGLTSDGHLDVRDQNAVPLADRANVKRLVAEENRDRDTLYTEIAKANAHPEWKSDIQNTFARRWIERAPAGTYYKDAGGTWKQK